MKFRVILGSIVVRKKWRKSQKIQYRRNFKPLRNWEECTWSSALNSPNENILEETIKNIKILKNIKNPCQNKDTLIDCAWFLFLAFNTLIPLITRPLDHIEIKGCRNK